MRVTQFDIAKLANVSQATVSRVLAGDDRVEDSIRARVMAVMQEKNYRPDVRGQALRSRRTGLIGLVLKRPHGGLSGDPFFAALTAGIIDFLCGRPYHLCVDMVTDEVSQEGVYDEMLRSRRVDGLILVEPEASDERIALLQRDRFPFVLIGNPKNEAVFSVDNDNVHAGNLAARHLYEQGYRDVAFLGARSGIAVSDDRIEGYAMAAAAYGETPRVFHAEFGYEAARLRAMEVFASGKPPGGLVVLDDFMAFGVYQAARDSGVEVPSELGLVAFNDSSLCSLFPGGLSSVSLAIDEIVTTALSKLLRVIESEPVSPVRDIVPCELRSRGSSFRFKT
ncbi:MAG TPA: LacI family DNA-binding transcriptional regulator [Fimbriimonadaceae bacterium]|nr:LacI family DNA-binding transcriptional regulator [Fimbriimonadaceae bacterium]